MKKKLLCILVSLALSLTVSAEIFEVDGIYYYIDPNNYSVQESNSAVVTCKKKYVNSEGIIIKGESDYTGDIIIPSEIVYEGTTYPVARIDGWAFDGCADVTSINIPNSVTSISIKAFRNCKSLTSLVIPSSVTYVDEWAFAGCSSLTTVTLPDGLTWIGDYAFTGCTSLTSVAIPNSVTKIANCVFSGCTNLISVTIPEGVTSIGYRVFEYCI